MGGGISRIYDQTYGSGPKIDRVLTARIIPGKEGVVTGGSSVALGKNLLADMGVSLQHKWSGYQAHHIIPRELADHPVLKKMGMDLDDASNGIFLRIPGDNTSARARHRGYHSVYSKFVKYELDKIGLNSSTQSLQMQVYALQLKLRKLQQSGLPMYESGGATIDLWIRYFNKLK